MLPLVIAEGAGAEMRRALRTAVFSGILGVTAFGLLFTPVFYLVVQWVRDRGAASADNSPGRADTGNRTAAITPGGSS